MSRDRDPGAPEMISAGDTPELKGMDYFFWTGLFAPKSTPSDIVTKLNKVFAEVLQEERVKSRFSEYGVKLSEPMTPPQYTAYVAKSSAEWANIVKQSGLKKN